MKRTIRAFHELFIADEDQAGNVVFYAVRNCRKCGFLWVPICHPKELPQNLWGECPYCHGHQTEGQTSTK